MKFETQTRVASYVKEEAEKGLPAGWILVPTRESLTWDIAREGKNPAIENYILTVSDDLEHFILYFDNTDAGPLYLHQVLLNAKVITAKGLDIFPLAKALAYLVAHCRVNRWGMT
jgi:hypothetical protein